MITNTKQTWTVGSQVKVGFLRLTILGFADGAYTLSGANGTLYEFEPHRGLFRKD